LSRASRWRLRWRARARSPLRSRRELS
jgi:hypothetical protein